MQAWVVVMIVMVVVAAALTVYGALSDRARNRRRAAEMLGPPQRAIPNLAPDARSPRYVTEAQARRRPDGAAAAATRAGTSRSESLGERADPGVEVAAGFASPDFLTEPGSREVVLEDALVLVCSDAVETIRELLPALEQALQTARPLVVVAPSIAQDVLGTLEVNAIQGLVPGVAVLADDAVRQQVVDASGAVPVDSTDRRSGWLDPQSLGHAARWTSTTRTSRVAAAIRTGAAE